MPMSGGTRMLRARRKDCNVKPNRRLDRKSSRGMLFENEELRMRTITINAEVEQGQHALKKLRRENEQLRREMWCLRDEYDKMEKLLRKREEGEESDQENSDSDENCGRTDVSEEDKGVRRTTNAEKEAEDQLSQFGSDTNARAFDGLSVIDEQTEETQTTESALGYGTLSRGNSANRTFNHSAAAADLPFYGYGVDPYADRTQNRRNGSAFPPDWPAGPHDTYDARPASPYPYTGSFQPSYQKRLQLLQQLPQTPLTPVGDSGWIFPPDPSDLTQIPNYNLYVDDPLTFIPPDPTAHPSPRPPPPPPPPPTDFHLIQHRAGPDVFVTGGYSRPDHPDDPDHPGGPPLNNIHDVQAQIEKIDISDKSELDPKAEEMTTFTKSTLSRGAAGLSAPTQPHETLRPGKLTMDAPDHQNHNGNANHLQHSVTCQNSDGQHVRETTDTVRQTTNTTPPPEDMPLSDKPNASKYQTKLTVTLKAPKKVPGPVAPRSFQPHHRHPPAPASHHPLTYHTLPAPPTHPPPTDPLPPHHASVRPAPFASLPRLPTFAPDPTPASAPDPPSDIPRRPDNNTDVLPHDDPLPVTQPILKPIKIPPPPPPRTSSCPKPIIPATSIGFIASHQRASRKGRAPPSPDEVDRPPEPAICNPLLMSQPIATSSPTISLRGANLPGASAESLWQSRYRKASYTEESSLEEFSRQKAKGKEDFQRREVPKLNKSLSSPSFGSFRTARRKQSEGLGPSAENAVLEKSGEAGEKGEKRGGKGRGSQNNASVSSSSGLDSPTKSEGRKRRVSIQLKKKKPWEREGEGGEEGEVGKGGGGEREKGRGRGEETDGTMSERERTNSVSSRASSVVGGSSRRKYSISSNRTYLNEEKIPWCGCWGNGCV